MISLYTNGLGKGRCGKQARELREKHPGRNSRIQPGFKLGTFWSLVRHSWSYHALSYWTQVAVECRKMVYISIACFPHLPLPRPLVISLSLLTDATSQAMTVRDCLEGFGHGCAPHCSAASTAQSHHPLRREIYIATVGIWMRSYGNTIFLHSTTTWVQ